MPSDPGMPSWRGLGYAFAAAAVRPAASAPWPAAFGSSSSADGIVSPVSISVLRLDRMAGQPWLTEARAALSGGSPSCTTVSLTSGPAGSSSNVTFDRGSAATVSRNSSVKPTFSANSGVKSCQVYDSRRYGSASRMTCSGLAIVTPNMCQLMLDPAVQSEVNVVPQYRLVNAGSVSACQSFSGVVAM